jgi:acylphosphatase
VNLVSRIKLCKILEKLNIKVILVCENQIVMIKHFNLTITGKVQRVGFRFTAMEAAYRFSIHGFVMNSGNADVYIEAEGTSENLEPFLAWCSKGPIGSRVDYVEVEEALLKNFTTFEIMSNT